jgi:hypothetical protein
VDFVILRALGGFEVGRRLHSVQDDWCAWLPHDKAQAFNAYAYELETLYIMFSIALNEALELRQTGMLAKSCRAASMTPELCNRLAVSLEALLRSLGDHAKHYGTIPNAVSLDPSNFQGPKEQRTARMSDLLSRVLFTQRSQFLHKVGTLAEMTEDIDKDFGLAVENLASGTSSYPEDDWRVVDAAHYDLNTCLREVIVLLKSFLIVLPHDQLPAFQRTVSSQMLAPQPPTPSSVRLIRTGRMASVEGE